MTANIQVIDANTDNFTTLFNRLNEVITAYNTIVITTDGGNTSISGLLLADSGIFTDLVANTALITSVNGSNLSYSTGTINVFTSTTLNVSGNTTFNVATGKSLTVSNTLTANVGSFETLTVNSNPVWTSGNDGAGSGLDADRLDGQEGTYYANVVARLGYTPLDIAAYTGASILSRLITVDGSGSNLDADFLDGQHGSYYSNASNMSSGTLPAGRLGSNTTYTVGGLVSNGTLSGYSDIRLKKNIETIENALEKVKELRGVYFDMNNRKMLGVIAQEVQEIIPEVIVNNDEYLSVMYGNLVGVLIEAIKDLDDKYVDLDERLKVLENK